MDLDDFREKAGINDRYKVQYGDNKSRKQLLKEVCEKSILFDESDFNFSSHDVYMRWTAYKKLLKLVEMFKYEKRSSKRYPYHECV